MRRLLPLVLLMLAASCGVDGPPEPPRDREAPAGVTISGDVRIGVAGRL